MASSSDEVTSPPSPSEEDLGRLALRAWTILRGVPAPPGTIFETLDAACRKKWDEAVAGLSRQQKIRLAAQVHYSSATCPASLVARVYDIDHRGPESLYEVAIESQGIAAGIERHFVATGDREGRGSPVVYEPPRIPLPKLPL